MRKTVKIGSKEISVKLLATILIICSLLTTGVVVALVSVGVIQIGYKITPTTTEAPTLTPSTISLDLGSIPSGTSGTKDFGKVATLELPVGYEIRFTLDITSAEDFPTFNVNIWIYTPGDPTPTQVPLNKGWLSSNWLVLDAGTYDIHVEVTYTATDVTSETTGTVEINVSK